MNSNTVKLPSKLYRISMGLANSKNITTTFRATILIQTERGGVYVYGIGECDPEGRCCRCGRRLTHPVSILTGIGPECGEHWWDESVLGPYGFTNEHAEQLKEMIRSVVVDCWLPINALHEIENSETFCYVEVPADHKMLQPYQPSNGTSSQTESSEPPSKPILRAEMDGTGKFLVVRFPYDKDIVEKVRTLEGRKWNPDQKVWTAWAGELNTKKLKEWGFDMDEKLQKVLKPVKAEEVKVKASDIGIPGLYPFQVDGIKFIEAKEGKCLIGDEMGLGKTIQALGWLKLHPELRPVVIVVPASLKLNWEREIIKWIGTETKVVLLSGKKPSKKVLKGRHIAVINYDILSSWLKTLMDWSPQILIADESHYIKNNKAQRTKAVKELAKSVAHTLFLTGTPIINRPVEFFTVLNLLAPQEFPSWLRYTQKYCGAYHDGYGWNVSGATNTSELFDRVNGKIMLRRKKEEVLKDLPTKRRFVVPMEINNGAEYLAADNNLIQWVKEKFGPKRAEKTSQAEALTRFSYLKQLASEGKRQAALSWIQDALDTNGKLVLFAVHHTMIDWLQEQLVGYNPVVVDGRVGQDKRQAAVDRFQNDPTCKVFIGNIKAAGVGLTLTAASTTVFLELGWTPGEHDQAEDRVHRIGQEADRVEAYYLVAANTIEEEIAGLLDEKREVLSAVLDGKKDVDEGNLLTELLKKRLED